MPYMDSRNTDRLVNTYADMILRISYMYLKQTYDAEDICQNVFLKLLSEDYSFENAALLGKSENTISSYLTRGRKKLRSILEKSTGTHTSIDERSLLKCLLHLNPIFRKL